MPAAARLPVIVIGAGSAGLCTSYHLHRLGVEHAVLERGAVGESWATKRWDSFTLVTPNWTFRLPGFDYNGPEPDGFMPRDAIVARLQKYAEMFTLPVRAGVEVTRLRPAADGGWTVTTGEGDLTADNVVVASGAFPEPNILPTSRAIAPRVAQIHTSQYRNPSGLPPGGVLVVGSGQSGIQIAEELMDAGRAVTISIGKCPRAARRYRGQDIVKWLFEAGFFDQTLASLPSPMARFACNPQATGKGGGHDVDVWRLARRGAALVGRFNGAAGEVVELGADLRANLDVSEQRTRDLLKMVDDFIAQKGRSAPPEQPSDRDFSLPPQEAPPRLNLAERGISTVVWATGFRPSYPWIEGAALDANGFPVTQRGVTGAAGLYFVGVHFMHNRKSGLLSGVPDDARYVADHIAARAGARA